LAMNNDSDKIISFAEFELDTVHRRLSRDGETVALHAKAFDLLTFLVKNNGRIVSKDEILDTVWEGSFVEESNLVVQISNLRKILGETKNAPRFLITVPGKGYKFAAETSENLLLIETHSVSELTIEQEEITVNQPTFPEKKLSSLQRFGVAVFAVSVILLVFFVGWFWNRSTQATENKQVKIAKLTANGRVINLTISPDGKFAVFAQKDGAGESLWLRQLETGSEKQIISSRPLEYVGLTVSPDNQFIYASVFSKNEIDPILEKIPLLGGVSTQIPNMDPSASVTISPDGKRLAFTDSNSAENETFLGISDVDGANQRILIRAKRDVRQFPIFKSNPVAWSPVSNEIAISVTEKSENGSSATILMVNADDGNEYFLTEKRWKDIDDLAWLDADRLAFIASEEDGLSSQIWTFSRKTGETKQLTNELQPYYVLAAGSGKIVAVQVNFSTSLRIADLEEAEKMLKVREIFTAPDQIDLADWSANGEIIYASQASGKRELWRMNSDGANRTQITFDAHIRFGLAVSPADGSLIFGSKQADKKGIWQTDSNGKNLRRLSDGNDQLPDVSNDGKIVFHRGLGYAEGVFVVSNNEPNPRLIRENCYFPAISPDGLKVACYFMDWNENRQWNIALVAADSGELIRKIALPIPIYERQIRFHPSGRFITQIFSEGENLKMILLPTGGGEPKIFEGLGKGSSNLPEWSPDGKQFIYPLVNETHDAVLLNEF
jgi:DNA-binding winged helix-turn-helix (wHTH) protein/Tol biopolymer transport system component